MYTYCRRLLSLLQLLYLDSTNNQFLHTLVIFQYSVTKMPSNLNLSLEVFLLQFFIMVMIMTNKVHIIMMIKPDLFSVICILKKIIILTYCHIMLNVNTFSCHALSINASLLSDKQSVIELDEI